MCGIWALIKANPKLTYEIINSFNSIEERGPDSSSIYLNKNIILGFHRLAINDLSVYGNQPFYYSTKEFNYTLICNGEIYNHTDLQKEYNINVSSTSDCAVLLPLFLKLNENLDMSPDLIAVLKYICFRFSLGLIIVKNDGSFH